MKKTRNLLLLILCVMGLLCAVTALFSGAEKVDAADQFYGYTAISTKAELLAMPDSGNYYLTADIDMGGEKITNSIANYYYGILDGNGHKIYNYSMDFNVYSGYYFGLFGVNIGTVRNLDLDCTLMTEISATTTTKNLGILCGYNSGTIENCKASGEIVFKSSTVNVGGIAGSNSGNISYSSANVTISNVSSNSLGNCYVGGLAGDNKGGLSHSSASGSISIGQVPSISAGGLVGVSSTEITDSFATASVSVDSTRGAAGGLVGRMTSGSLYRCHASGNVTNAATAAATDGDAVYLGGLVGGTHVGTIKNCYATGRVTNTGGHYCQIGGLVGQTYCEIYRSYASGDVHSHAAGQSIVGGLVGYTLHSISGCYSTGSITAVRSDSSLLTAAGGLVGIVTGADGHDTTISYSFSASDVNVAGTVGSSSVGKLIGGISDFNNVTACYTANESTCTGGTVEQRGTATAKSNFKSKAFLTGTLKWGEYAGLVDVAKNPENVWVFDGGEYPVLSDNLVLPYSVTIGLNTYPYYYKAIVSFESGSAKLDGQPYKSGDEIIEVGNHELEFTYGGEVIAETIVVHSYVQGITGNSSWQCPVVENCTLLLNGQPFKSSTEITRAGNYELKILGTGGYEDTQNFTVNHNESQIYNGKTSEFYAAPNCTNSEILINGQPFTVGHRYYGVGNNKIEFIGENGYTRTHNFVITPRITGVAANTKYVGEVTPVIDHCTLLLDGQPYESGTPINDAGKYTLTIKGNGSYEQTLSFEILPIMYEVTDVAGGKMFTVYRKASNISVTVNGEKVTDSFLMKEAGNYKVEITDGKDHNQTLDYTVESTTDIINGSTYDKPVWVQTKGTKTFLDGQEINAATLVSGHGRHTLRIEGEGGYVQEIEFYYDNINMSLVWIILSAAIVCVGAGALMVVWRVRSK